MDNETKAKCDRLIEKLKKTFSDPSNFEPGSENPSELYTNDVALDYGAEIDNLLITNGGQCNWDNMIYIEDQGNFWIHSGEKDSFGWLTGIIEPKPQKDIKMYIIYG